MFDKRQTGELLSRLTSDCTSLQDVATTNISMFVRGVVTIIFSGGLMFYNSWQLATLIVCVMPLGVILISIYSPVVKRLAVLYTDSLAAANNTAEQSISNIRTVRSFAAEKLECTKYERSIGNPDDHEDRICCWWTRRQSALKAGMKKQFVGAFFGAFVFVISTAAIIAVIWFGAYRVISGDLSLGKLSAFIMYSLQIAGSVGTMGGLYTSLISAKGASRRAFQLIDRRPRVPLKEGDTLESLRGAISFENVTFSYDTRPDHVVLKDFSLDIQENSHIAFVGSSGAGKSTVFALLQRFYDVDEGRICIDGRALTSLNPSWLRQHFALVQQEPPLFAGSIEENIAYGFAVREARPDARPPQEQLEQVARKAFAHDFIMQFPEGYQTIVGERGVRLSGGQKQRIAIARALLMDPRVLLLDEATSALDAESEHIVAAAIREAMSGRTTLIIAHRLSTVKSADKICVVECGTILAEGGHDELIQSCERYRDLVRRQMSAASPNTRSTQLGTAVPAVVTDTAAGVSPEALEEGGAEHLKQPLLNQN